MNKLFDDLHLQIRFVMSFSVRDAPKRVGTAAFTCAIIFYFGAVETSLTLAALVIVFEALRYLTARNVGNSDQLAPFQVALFTLTYCASTFFYCSIGVFLLQLPYATAHIFGVFWISAIAIHTISANTMIATFAWLTILSVVAAVGLAGVLWSPPVFIEKGSLDATLFVVITLIWLANLVQCTRLQGSNRAAFTEARVNAEERLNQLEFLAHHDALTGLLNRRAFDDALQAALDDGAEVIVALIDLDRFKPINDTFGHAMGDAVLVTQANRIIEVFGAEQAARLGGDEFAVFATGNNRKAFDADVARLGNMLCDPLVIDGQMLDVGASIGVAIGLPHRDTPDSVCAAADRAMYQEKEARQAQYPERRAARHRA